MKNSNPEIVEIMDDYPPKFRCKKCGVVWLPNIRPDSNGRFYRGSWQCPYGCKPDTILNAP